MKFFSTLIHLSLPFVLAAPAHADALDDQAAAAFTAAYADTCNGAFLEDGALIDRPQRFALSSRSSYDDAIVPMQVWLFRCNIGAYNVQSVLFGFSEAEGVTPLPLARPDLDIILEDPDDLDSAVREVRIVGWSASAIVVNAEVDAASGELRETGYWRGLGDASSSGVWRLVDEGFRLVRYDVDPTYDSAVNPVAVVQFE